MKSSRYLYRVIGFRSASPEEIQKMVAKWKSRGYSPEHHTEGRDGRKLPFNGVLRVYY